MAAFYQAVPIDGIEDLEESVRGSHLEPTQLKPGSIKGTLVQAGLGTATLSSGAFRGEAHVTGPLSDTDLTIGLLLKTEGANSQWSYETQGGDIAVVPPNVAHDARHGESTHWVTLTLPLEIVLEQAEVRQPHLTEAFWQQPEMYRPSPKVAVRTVDRFQTALRGMARNPDLLQTPNARDAMLDDLIGSTLQAFGSGGREPIVTRRTFISSSRIVRAAEEYLRAHVHDPVRLPQLCRHLGVAERSLYRAFHEVLHVSPAVYLRRWRLCQARRMLANPQSADLTVADAALHFGFWELGRFAGQYRHLFGGLPSETLTSAKQA